MGVASRHVKHDAIESAGCVIEPRNLYGYREADGVHLPEGSIPDHLMAVVIRTRSGSKSGAC
jgi:hypothetical protein